MAEKPNKLSINVDIAASPDESSFVYTPYPMIFSPYVKRNSTPVYCDTNDFNIKKSNKNKLKDEYNSNDDIKIEDLQEEQKIPWNKVLFESSNGYLNEKEQLTGSDILQQSWSDMQNLFKTFESTTKNIDAIGYCMLLSEDNVSWPSAEFLLRWCCNFSGNSKWMRMLQNEIKSINDKETAPTLKTIKEESYKCIRKICYTFLQRINKVFIIRGDVKCNIWQINKQTGKNNKINFTIKNCSLLQSAIVHNSYWIVNMFLRFQQLEEERLLNKINKNKSSLSTTKEEKLKTFSKLQSNVPFTTSKCYIELNDFFNVINSQMKKNKQNTNNTSNNLHNITDLINLEIKKFELNTYVILNCLQLSALLGNARIFKLIYEFIYKESMVTKESTKMKNEIKQCFDIASVTENKEIIGFLKNII